MSSQATTGSDFIRLRTMLRWTSKVSLGFGEDVPALLHYAVARKKRLSLLSEVVLRTVKRRLTSSFAIFLDKKMAAGFFIASHHSETHFELKNSEFGCEIKF